MGWICRHITATSFPHLRDALRLRQHPVVERQLGALHLGDDSLNSWSWVPMRAGTRSWRCFVREVLVRDDGEADRSGTASESDRAAGRVRTSSTRCDRARQGGCRDPGLENVRMGRGVPGQRREVLEQLANSSAEAEVV